MRENFMVGGIAALEQWEHSQIVAGGVLIVNSQGKVLAFARRGNPNDRATIGGKIDSGETIFDAVIREVWEETGIIITTEELRQAQVFIMNPVDMRNAYAAFVIRRDNLESNIYSNKDSNEGYATWELPEILMQETGQFWRYCAVMLSQISLEA